MLTTITITFPILWFPCASGHSGALQFCAYSKNINHAATREANVAKAAELLEKLYVMLCYSCRYTLFSAYDSFQSVGVAQEDFFRAVLRHKRHHENPRILFGTALSWP
jgi:hypothetical protein